MLKEGDTVGRGSLTYRNTKGVPADGRAGGVAAPAEDGRGERLEPGVEAEVLADEPEAETPDKAGSRGQHAAEQEGQGDRLVLVDAHQRGGLAILRGCPHRPAESRPADE